jgi:hypothetical protein
VGHDFSSYCYGLLFLLSCTHTQIKCYVDVFCPVYFVCPSDGDVKSEVPCSVNATPVYVKYPSSSSSFSGAVCAKIRHHYEAAT